MIRYLFALITLCVSVLAQAQQPLPLDQAFQFSASAKDSQTILLNWQIAPGYYLYQDAFKITAAKPAQLSLPAPILPIHAINKSIPAVGTKKVYNGRITLAQPVLSSPEPIITLHVHYQGCSQYGFCYPPVTQAVTINLASQFNKPIHGVMVQSGEPSRLSQPASIDHIERKLLSHQGWHTWLAFLVFGLLIAFTPCVLPMIPILSSIIIGQKKPSHARAFLLSFAYVLGMAITYALAGILFGHLGHSLQASLQQPWIIIVFAGIFVAMACSLFGLYTIQLPSRLQNRLAQFTQHPHHSVIGALIMGVLSTLVLSPCVTPPLVAVLTFISQTGNATIGGLALFSMGLGMGLPLLLIGGFGPRLLPQTGRWMVTIKQVLGMMLLAMAVWMLSRIMPDHITMLAWALLALGTGVALGALNNAATWLGYLQKALGLIALAYGIVLLIGAWQGQTNPLQPLRRITTHNDLLFKRITRPDDVYQALKTHPNKPVLLDFYAKWCVSCQEMDARTFSDPRVRQTLQSYTLLRADITKNTHQDQLLMQHFHVVAPPTLIVLDTTHPPKTIVGFVTARELLRHLKQPSS